MFDYDIIYRLPPLPPTSLRFEYLTIQWDQFRSFSLIFIEFRWFSWIFNDFRWFSMIFMDFHWISLIFIVFHWFSLFFIDFHWFWRHFLVENHWFLDRIIAKSWKHRPLWPAVSLWSLAEFFCAYPSFLSVSRDKQRRLVFIPI